MKKSQLRQLIRETIKSSVNEGKGLELADRYVAKLRQEFKNLNDDEVNEFRKAIAEAFDLRWLVYEGSVNEGWSIINNIKFDDSLFDADHEWMIKNKFQLAQIINRNIASSNIMEKAKEENKNVTISLT